jgi:predicted RNase H-like nuclease (RuvC/YqgF family)
MTLSKPDKNYIEDLRASNKKLLNMIEEKEADNKSLRVQVNRLKDDILAVRLALAEMKSAYNRVLGWTDHARGQNPGGGTELEPKE